MTKKHDRSTNEAQRRQYHITKIYHTLSPYLCKCGIRIPIIQRYVEKRIFPPLSEHDFKNIPIYILSYNRLSYLKLIITSLESYGYTNIIIIDNASTYPPLLEYYKSLNYNVIHMDQNHGHNVFFTHRRFRKIRASSFYVYTDPDILPIIECPDNFIEVFFHILMANPCKVKVGFSLKIDDIPNKYLLKQEVIAWESRFYNIALQYNGIQHYDAPIDTTFALYRPKMFWPLVNSMDAMRVAPPYQAHHLPWYKGVDDLSDEDIYYNKSKLSTTGNWNYDTDKETILDRYRLTEHKGKQS